MDEKTAELRDLFLDVTDEEAVTESQEAGPGSLTDEGRPAGERLRAVVETMRETFSFETGWSTDEYCTLVRGFYDGAENAALGERVDRSREAVFRARMDLHLCCDDDPPGDGIGEADRRAVCERAAEGSEALAAALGLDQEAVDRCLAVCATEDRSRRVSHRFRTAFEEILTDTDLLVEDTADTHEDGLDDATAGAEVDVDF